MITVTTLSGDKWTVWRRYSNFVELDETLPEPTASELAGARKWGPTSDMSWNYETDSPTTVPFSPHTLPRPPLPPKTLNTHIPTRQAQLNTYLHMLLLNPAVRSHPSFLSFIGADQLLLTPTTANLTSFQYAFRSQAGFVGKTKDDVQEYFCNVL
ncbi:hypothetical protein TeGR_g2981 [Tetraparma gracilis]|uniref:PX domain-containing protein n=1 Tax=Tetraparma gracilis TaxID=2962635 RepID=A0ABQ6N5X2_9STRA|nr:hypothetical protein TeGR_g2981 [Tetraparma gracilis]